MEAELDQYYTNKDVAQECIRYMLEIIPVNSVKWIEPSAGTGNFLFSSTYAAFDLEPMCGNVVKQNWLTTDLPSSPFAVYGNPPYGKRNSLSKEFIKKSLSDTNCKAVCFLLPSVFQKHTLQKVFPSTWALAGMFEPSPDSFEYQGKPYKIPCVFQVWIRKEFINVKDLRQIERLTFENKHFSIVKRGGDLFVMGAAPKTIKMPDQVTDNNRGYWLKAHIPLKELINNFKAVVWEGKSSASGGVYWLTKTELINKYEEFHSL